MHNKVVLSFITPKRIKIVEDTANNHLSKRQNENKKLQTQLTIMFEYLQKYIATASMVSAATGIPQKNICRYKRNLEKAGQLWEIEKKACKKTGLKAWYLTTNPKKVPLNNQLRLFQI